MTLLEYYKNIFNHKNKDCKLIGTKLLNVSEGKYSSSRTYKILSIVKLKTTLPNFSPNNNAIILLKNLRFNKIGGPDVRYQLKWRTDKGKIKKFTISGQITPETILDFEAKDGFIYVKVILYGSF